MKEAFYYMFKDSAFKKKALMYFIFALISNLLTNYAQFFEPAVKSQPGPPQYYILAILGFIAALIPCGYGILCIKSIMEQKENIVLPFLNVGKSMLTGFKMFVSVILLTLIILAVSVIPLILAFGVIKNVFSIIIVGALFIAFIVVMIYFPMAFSAIFAKTGEIKSFIRFKKANELIKASGILNYLKYVGLFIVLTFLSAFINGIFIEITASMSAAVVGIAISSVIISLIASYTMFVFSYIVARSVNPELI